MLLDYYNSVSVLLVFVMLLDYYNSVCRCCWYLWRCWITTTVCVGVVGICDVVGLLQQSVSVLLVFVMSLDYYNSVCRCCWYLQREDLTVEKLLNRFVTMESVDDVVCDRCKRGASFVKKLTLGKVYIVFQAMMCFIWIKCSKKYPLPRETVCTG